MTGYNSNYDIALKINTVLGNSHTPFDSINSICYNIYVTLGGTEEQSSFDSTYSILEAILTLLENSPVADISLLDEIYYTLTGEHSNETDARTLTNQIISLINDLQDVATNAEIDLLFTNFKS